MSDERAFSTELVAEACLTVINGPGAGKVYRLTLPEVVIGRGGEAQVRLDDKTVSTSHAKIVKRGETHYLEDLGSTNGSFLNGRRLAPRESVGLTPGDSVQFSETVLAYLLDPQADVRDETRQLSRLAPRLPGSMDLMMPQAQLLAQLLSTQSVPATASAPEGGPSIDEIIQKIQQVWAIVKRHRVRLLALAAIGALLGDLSVFALPPPSEATFRLRVAPKSSDNPLRPSPTENRDDAERFYAGVEQGFESSILIRGTLELLGNKEPSLIDVNRVAKALKFESVAIATYQATYTHRDPQYAVRFLTTHLNNFLNTEVTKASHVTQTQVEFLRNELKVREKELQETEAKIKSFKDEHLEGLPAVAQSDFAARGGLFLRRADLSAQLSKANLERDLARRRFEEGAPLLARKVASASPYEQSLVDVNRKMGEARAKGLKDDHPEVVALKAQAAELERLAAQARATTPSALDQAADPALIQLKNRVGDLDVVARGLGAELGAVNAQLERINSAVKQMPEVEASYAQLTRSYEATRSLHDKLFQELRTSELDLELQRTSAKARFDILSQVSTAGIRIRVVSAIRAGIGAAIGLVLAVLWAAILELRGWLRRRMSTTRAIVPIGRSGG